MDVPTALDPDYELKAGAPYPFDGMLLERDGFRDFARGLGIDNDSLVVVHDEKFDAPRLWWAFSRRWRR